ncbi:DEKNAAC104002 [Brettanomyces naardenensis]|uniref:Putative tyrosine-protein phosphatase OCA1 n=1 Tax=Brettanomyces naardenensis TaxID=13370 RepID=A0A448YQ35_BRENA|nr:DEKNAAC104002 [Brettanomyces naardenensis]
MDEKGRALTQGDQILDQLRQYDEKKHLMLRSRSSESQLSTRFQNQGGRLSMSRSRNVSVSSKLSEQFRQGGGGGGGILGGPNEGATGGTVTTQVSTVPPAKALAQDEPLNSQLDLVKLVRKEKEEEISVTAGVQRVHIFDLEEFSPSHQYTSLKIEDVRPRYVPPINFAIVESDLYRSGHPQPFNFDFLKTLKLRTIIYLGDKVDNYDYYRWIKDNGISFKFFRLKEVGRAGKGEDGEGEDTASHSEAIMNSVLNLLLNRDNYPVLIHSNKGKHRVGVLVGLVRAYLQGWTLSGAFDEYGKFSHEKGDYDLEFVEMFKPNLKVDEQKIPEFVRLSR